MSRLINDPDVQINSVHCRAICEEIGYRLRQTLNNDAAEHPRHLELLDRLRRQDVDGAPSIVPSFDDIARGPYRTSTPLRKRTS